MPTLEFAPQLAGDPYGVAGTYPPAASGWSQALTGHVAKRALSGGNYLIYTPCLRFDTSSLPDDCTVTSASLRITVVAASNTDDRALTVEWYDPGAAVDSGDYTSTAAATANSGVNLSTLAAKVGQSYDIPLTGLANISRTGSTGLRLHVSGSTPTGSNYVTFRSAAQSGLSPLVAAYVSAGGNLTETARIMALLRRSGDQRPRLIVIYAEAGQAPSEQPPAGTSNDPGSSWSQPVAWPGRPEPTVHWRLVLCDELGAPIANLTRVATGRKLVYTLNRPATFTFQLAADDPLVSALHTDGLPMLEPLVRTVKAYRREPVAGGHEWALRFAGHVWQVEDDGDHETAKTAVVCFDPLQMLSRRRTAGQRAFTNTDGGTIVRTLVDEANQVGRTGLTTEGAMIEATPARTVTYQYVRVSEAVIALATAFNGFDLWAEPVDRRDGVLAVLHVLARKGVLQTNVVFGWGVAPHNVRGVKRLLDGETVANEITGLGSAVKTAALRNEDSIRRLKGLILQDVESYSDVTNQVFLDALIAEELGFRAKPRELVSISPQPGRAWQPFTHYQLGDSFYVYTGTRLRGGFAGIQRCYSFTIDIDDDGVESVGEIVASPQ